MNEKNWELKCDDIIELLAEMVNHIKQLEEDTKIIKERANVQNTYTLTQKK